MVATSSPVLNVMKRVGCGYLEKIKKSPVHNIPPYIGGMDILDIWAAIQIVKKTCFGHFGHLIWGALNRQLIHEVYRQTKLPTPLDPVIRMHPQPPTPWPPPAC